MLIDNTFGITMAMQFDEAVTGQDGTSGVYCASKLAVKQWVIGLYTFCSSTCVDLQQLRLENLLTSFDGVEAENLNL